MTHLRNVLPLLLAAIGWYASSRLAVYALAISPRASLRRGMAQAIPVLFLVIAAVVMGQPQIAIGVIFGTSVAALSLVLGVVIFTAPPDMIAVDARRKWGFVLPAALLTFLAGFQSQFTMLHAAVFALEGVVVLLVWMDREGASGIDSPAPDDAAPLRVQPAWVVPALLTVAIGIATAAAYAGVFGANRVLAHSSLPSMSIVAALLLAPALIIAMIGSDTLLAQKGHFTDAVSSHVAFVLINLCVILPMLIVGWHFRFTGEDASPLVFPLIVWRVDTVMLLLLGLALLPMSLGRWRPGHVEGIMLILLYVAYMVLWRWGSAIG